MMPFIPILLVLAGLTFFLSRRRYKAIEGVKDTSTPTPPRVVVKGHTYSDSVETTVSQPRQRSTRVENVRRCCIIGAGRVGALTGVALASQNPEVQFFVVDHDTRLIAAWNSNRLPVIEPGLDAMLFGNEPTPAIAATPVDGTSAETDSRETALVKPEQRRRKLPNLTFSTNVHAGITAAEMVFLCVETPSPLFDDENTKSDLSSLYSAVQSIAHAASGHKIIVQKTTAPCGIVQEIKNRLKETASPSATFDVLSNPEFIIPGSALQDLLHPPRVIIGHMYTTDMSPAALTALTRLYTPWVPPERILTMDAWSSELGKMAANALIAQQIASLNALSALCEGSNADIRHVVDMAGVGGMARCGRVWSMNEVRCLVYLAREMGLQPVAEYWGAVLKMEGFHQRRIARRVLGCLEGDVTARTVAVLGAGFGLDGTGGGGGGSGWNVVKELEGVGVAVRVYDAFVGREQVEEGLRLRGVDGAEGRVVVADSVEEACTGCSAVVLHSDCEEFGRDETLWRAIAAQMEMPRVLFDAGGNLDRFAMQQCGFQVLQLGVK